MAVLRDPGPDHGDCPRLQLGDAVGHVARYTLAADDLLFARRGGLEGRRRLTELPEIDSLGLTKPNEAGRQYPHGTTTAYGLGRCRCEHCRHAVALYRAQRRRAGTDRPARGFVLDPDPHLDGKSFRTRVLQPALDRAGVVGLTMHGLRHAHASWLLAGGADLQVVKERLGHAKMTTTEGCLHTLPSADDTALTALGKIRGSGAADEQDELIVAKREIEELKAVLVTVTLRLTQPKAEAPRAPEARNTGPVRHVSLGEVSRYEGAQLAEVAQSQGRVIRRAAARARVRHQQARAAAEDQTGLRPRPIQGCLTRVRHPFVFAVGTELETRVPSR
jgi:hypothetical protein